MPELKNSFDAEQRDAKIREISGRGHAVGLDTPFTFSALRVYDAGGKLDSTTEGYMVGCGFINKDRTLTEDGKLLVELHTQRGDRPYIWSQEMSQKAQNAPKLVAAA